MSDEHATRHTIDLDGSWEFVTDPAGRGINNGWYDPDVEWPDRSRHVSVPMSWEELDAYRDYRGTAWYRRTVDLSETTIADRDAILRFGAVDYETTVWVNGQEVGYNRGGYLPFELDATDALSEHENTIVVRVTDPADISEIPHGKQGDPWYTRVSGIWQSVNLCLRPPTRVEDTEVHPDLSTDTATVEATINSGSRSLEDLHCELRAERGGDVVATATVSAEERIDAVLSFSDPDYWRPDDPVLYDLTVTVHADGDELDRYTDTFGLRSFTISDDQFLLNGQPMTLRGVLEQGYYPDTNYRPPDSDTFEREIDQAKALGFNLIRKHIKPAHPDFLDKADRKGILVWEELANPIRYTADSVSAMRTQLENLVARDFNHPSVVIWGLFNEEWGIGHHDIEETLWTDEEKQRTLADMVQTLRERDVTRLVCDNSGWAHVSTDLNDFHRYFVSPDQARDWELDLDHICHYPADNFATDAYDSTAAPIVISELGTWGFADVSTLRESYGGDPPWFFHDFLTEPMKSPAGIDDRFQETDLATIFGDYDTLAAAWQRREFVSLKHLIGQIRRRDCVAGYVLTQLSDIEWEFNGLFDYLRTEKNFVDEFAAVNGAVSVVVEPALHVGWAGTTQDLSISVVNDTRESLSGTLTCSFGDVEQTTTVTVPGNGVVEVEDISIDLSAGEPVTREQLHVAFESGAPSVETTEPITIVDRGSLTPPEASVFARGSFASGMAGQGLAVTHDLERADIAFVDRITEAVREFASDGGAVVQIPMDDGKMRASDPFSFHSVPEPETWIGTASFFYQNSPLLADICSGPRLGWEFETLYPNAVVTDLTAETDDIHAGYVEGWLANWGSPLVSRAYGDGSMTALTFPIRNHYGTHPVGTLLVNRVIRTLCD